MSYRAFTWWRRFHTPIKLKKEQLWKGYSPLLQRIEFGEFEYCHLSEEILLEEAIFAEEEKQIRLEMSRSSEESIQERIYDRRALKNKRVQIMMKNHLEKEHAILKYLKDSLSAEFNLPLDFVSEFFETFNGNTRQLYYALRAVSQNRPIPPNKTIDTYPRAFAQQPQHILKHEHRNLYKLWKKVVKDNKIHNAHGITD